MADTIRYTYNRAPAVARGWGALTIGLLLQPLSGLVLAARGGKLPKGESVRQDITSTAILAAAMGSPWLTFHELQPDRAVLRLGLYFRGAVAYANIASVHATERKSSGFPLRLYRHTLFLALWPRNLVEIRLRRPQRFRLFHLLPVWKVREIVLNVDEREDFISDLRSRLDPAAWDAEP
jgi:hypothetical protein